MNLNNDVVYRCRRLGPLHQRHPGRSRSLIRHHNRLHQAPPRIQSSPLHHEACPAFASVVSVPRRASIPCFVVSLQPVAVTRQPLAGPGLSGGGQLIDTCLRATTSSTRRTSSPDPSLTMTSPWVGTTSGSTGPSGSRWGWSRRDGGMTASRRSRSSSGTVIGISPSRSEPASAGVALPRQWRCRYRPAGRSRSSADRVSSGWPARRSGGYSAWRAGDLLRSMPPVSQSPAQSACDLPRHHLQSWLLTFLRQLRRPGLMPSVPFLWSGEGPVLPPGVRRTSSDHVTV